MKNIIQKNYKYALTFILGLIVAGGFAVYAAISASSVGYTDNYNLGSTNVQGAIE